MSAQHTQERLEVTDETNEDGRVYLTIKSKNLALGTVFNLQMRGNTLNDARRLAACWNACEGLETDKLERMPATFAQMLNVGFIDLWEQYTTLKEQRADLLQALQGMVDYYGTASANVEALEAARAALSKAEIG